MRFFSKIVLVLMVPCLGACFLDLKGTWKPEDTDTPDVPPVDSDSFTDIEEDEGSDPLPDPPEDMDVPPDGPSDNPVYVAPDGDESDLRPLTAPELVESLPDQPVYVAHDLDELRDAIHRAARGSPIWDYFLILVLIIATVEALFANRYRPTETRMPTQAPPAAAA